MNVTKIPADPRRYHGQILEKDYNHTNRKRPLHRQIFGCQRADIVTRRQHILKHTRKECRISKTDRDDGSARSGFGIVIFCQNTVEVGEWIPDEGAVCFFGGSGDDETAEGGDKLESRFSGSRKRKGAGEGVRRKRHTLDIGKPKI